MDRSMMRRWSVGPLLLSAMLLVSCASPSPSPVDEIVDANLAARGGAERIRALQSIRQTGVVTASGGRTARVVRELKRPGMVRLEFIVQGTTAVFAHDGGTGWQVAPLQGQFDPVMTAPGGDAVAGVDQRDLEGHLVDWREKGHTIELVGREMLPGGEADVLKVTLSDGSVRTDYVDVATRLIVRSDVTRLVQGRPVQLENTLSDFREVDGLVFPFRMETRARERPEVVTIVVDTIELDPELDDERFQFPE